MTNGFEKITSKRKLSYSDVQEATLNERGVPRSRRMKREAARYKKRFSLD